MCRHSRQALCTAVGDPPSWMRSQSMRSYSPQCRSLVVAAAVTPSSWPVSTVTRQAGCRRCRPSTTSCLRMELVICALLSGLCTQQRILADRHIHCTACHPFFSGMYASTLGTRRRGRRCPAEFSLPAVHGYHCTPRHCWRWRACWSERQHMPRGARPTTPWQVGEKTLLTGLRCIQDPLQAPSLPPL
jgi:hypothetical protein